MENELDAWSKEKRSVTLTNDQWNTLVCYLRMSTKHREGERDAWQRLAEEKNPDGSPKFKNAADNAAFWQETIAAPDTMILKLDGLEV